MSETYTPDNLIAGDFPMITGWRTIPANAAALVRGSVLGKILFGATTKTAESAAHGAGAEDANTGDGTLTLDATTPVQAGAKAGIYKVRISRIAIAQVGTTPAVPAQKTIATLTDPDGNVLAVVDVLGSGGTTITNQVKFAIAEGSTPFALTDGFDITVAITVAAGSGEAKLVDSSAVDGSQAPECVLLEATAVSTAAQVVPVALTGAFASAHLVFGGSDTYATHADALRALSIFGKTTLAA